MSQGADPDEIGLMNIDEQLPVLEYPQPGLDIIKVLRAGGQAGSAQSPRPLQAPPALAPRVTVPPEGPGGRCGWERRELPVLWGGQEMGLSP